MVNELREIQTIDDIKLLVNNFYDAVKQDVILKDIFNNVIQDRWPQHLTKMYTFWQTVLLGEYTYEGTPFPPHAKLPIDKQHFERWVQLFNTTVNTFFIGEKAEKAKWQGNRMAEMFLSKINYSRNNNSIPLV